MVLKLRLNFLVAGACLFLGANLLAADTNSLSATSPDFMTQTTANSLLQIQEQLHNAQLAIDAGRQEAAAEARRNTEAMATRIQSLEQTVAQQRTSQVETSQKSQQLMLGLAGVFGVVILLVVLLMAYLQWRAVARLVELSALRPLELTNGGGRAQSLGNAATVEANTRLFSAVDQLEKRILGLEQTTRTPLAAASATVSSSPAKGNSAAPDDRDDRITDLLADGQTLLNANEATKALQLFENALAIDALHAEALVKKGGALEKLDRLDEAVACYDRAIAADRTLTVAYLHKGGLFNRMARYEEALRCYEQALRTQEKDLPRSEVA
jgi:tetratricopeptide (TPR) repeat protein